MNKQAHPAEVIVAEPQTAVAVRAPTPLEIFAQAVDKGVDLEKMKLLKEMVEWHEGREAEKAFNRAMTGFRSKSITILKNRHVKYENKGGGFTEYDHADLYAAVEAIAPHMSEFGLSHRWERRASDGEKIRVACVITHELGHSIETDLSGLPDNSGGKNAIQAVGSAVSYLERYTLLMLVGLAAKGTDNDGAPPKKPDVITPEQVNTLAKLIKDVGADFDLFLKWAKVETLDDLPVRKFDPCMARLKDMQKEQQKS